MFGFLFKSEAITYQDAFKYIGFIAIGVALIVMVTRFDKLLKVKVSKEELQLEEAVAA